MQSKKIVIATIGSLGDLHPAIALALELQRRGHQITLATSSVYEQKIEQAGINFHALRPHMPDNPEIVEKIMHPTKGAEFCFCELLLPRLSQTYTDLMDAVRGCNLLITNEIIFPASAISEKTGIPWISYTLQPASLFSVYDPPVLTGAPYLAKSRFLGVWVVKLFKQFVKFMTRSWAEPIRQLRKEVGLDNTNEPSVLFEGKFSPNLVLAMFSSVFAKPQPDWIKQIKITGFAFYDRHSSGNSLSGELQKFLATGEAPIVFTLGSAVVQTPGDFYRESLAAVQELNCRAVFLVGNLKLEMPSNAIAIDYAPYSELFPHAKAVVHQGGVGTTAQALRAGVPMLVVPFSYDQPDNAARVVRLGVGRTISRKKYRRDTAVKELQLLLSNPQYKTKALEVAQIIQAENGVETACDEIEIFLDSAIATPT